MKKFFWVMLAGQKWTGPFRSEKACDEATLRARLEGYSTYTEREWIDFSEHMEGGQ